MTTRTRRSREQWQQICQDQLDSGVSAQTFCAKHQLSYASFSKWRRKLDAPTAVEHSPLIDLSSFVAPPVPAWDIELDLGAGITLRMRRGA